ncbi:unnamed protein product [Protopolystoma xenopodis]|uniref:Uncharacterized protein n=1 Tax=Protopolystoma xenopodis TaxID=117903 RepID=A0A448XDC6_9PLAT|nr:unnamed protein product [Protopolystoma xenopodis]
MILSLGKLRYEEKPGIDSFHYEDKFVIWSHQKLKEYCSDKPVLSSRLFRRDKSSEQECMLHEIEQNYFSLALHACKWMKLFQERKVRSAATISLHQQTSVRSSIVESCLGLCYCLLAVCKVHVLGSMIVLARLEANPASSSSVALLALPSLNPIQQPQIVPTHTDSCYDDACYSTDENLAQFDQSRKILRNPVLLLVVTRCISSGLIVNLAMMPNFCDGSDYSLHSSATTRPTQSLLLLADYTRRERICMSSIVTIYFSSSLIQALSFCFINVNSLYPWSVDEFRVLFFRGHLIIPFFSSSRLRTQTNVWKCVGIGVLSDDAGYEAGEMSGNVRSPRLNAGNCANNYSRELRTWSA